MSAVKKLFTLDESVAHELELVAKALNTTQKEIVQRALDFYFDYTDAVVAQKIADDVKSKKEPVFDAKEVFEELGLDV